MSKTTVIHFFGFAIHEEISESCDTKYEDFVLTMLSNEIHSKGVFGIDIVMERETKPMKKAFVSNGSLAVQSNVIHYRLITHYVTFHFKQTSSNGIHHLFPFPSYSFHTKHFLSFSKSP